MPLPQCELTIRTQWNRIDGTTAPGNAGVITARMCECGRILHGDALSVPGNEVELKRGRIRVYGAGDWVSAPELDPRRLRGRIDHVHFVRDHRGEWSCEIMLNGEG